MKAQDFSRKIMIDVCANGSFNIRAEGAPMGDGLLPVFSTDTIEEAEDLQMQHCRRARDGSGLYFLNERPSSVEDLARVSDMLRASWEKSKKK